MTKLTLTKETTETLANFASISNSMIIPAGNRIRVINEFSTCIAYADIEETFPRDVALYDVAQFLSVQSLVNNGYIEFEDEYLLIKNDDNTTLRYQYSNPEFITNKAPERLDFPEEGSIKFTLTETMRDNINKATERLKLNAISFVSDAGSNKIYAAAIDEKQQNKNNFRILIGTSDSITDNTFSFNLQPTLIKTLKKGDYDVSVSPDGISEFKGLGVQYYIALSGKSTFE